MSCCRHRPAESVVKSMSDASSHVVEVRTGPTPGAQEGTVQAMRRVIDLPPIEWPNAADRWVIDWDSKLGEGAYGEVFKALDRRTGAVCCVKTIRKEKDNPEKIRSEVQMLQLLRDGPNIVQLLGTARTGDGIKLLVFEYIDSPYYKEYFFIMKDLQVRTYLYKLLQALRYTHAQGVIHRDIKGGNVLFEMRTQSLHLIDWGFAVFHSSAGQKDFPGTRYYKAPELILRMKKYTYAVDMWAFGCVLGMLIVQKNHLIKAKHNDDRSQMVAIGKLLGVAEYRALLAKYMPAYEDHFPARDMEDMRCPEWRVSWYAMQNERNQHLFNDDALDLLDRLLVWDHEGRLSAADALAHRYFDPVRRGIEGRRGAASSASSDSQSGGDDSSSLSSTS
eukprot:c21134_g1_i1.p1 GENE.c21134_g1_i1~~c21134_g1_i1.p1  ORF type:complete len:390 (+),score=73.16 c21134_g1_i1:67-1236(+)